MAVGEGGFVSRLGRDIFMHSHFHYRSTYVLMGMSPLSRSPGSKGHWTRDGQAEWLGWTPIPGEQYPFTHPSLSNDADRTGILSYGCG